MADKKPIKDQKYKLICLECKNQIDLTKYEKELDKFKEGLLEEDQEIIIECEHCGTDWLVVAIDADNNVEVEIIERDK